MKCKTLTEYRQAIGQKPDDLELVIDCADHCYNETMIPIAVEYYRLVLEKGYY